MNPVEGAWPVTAWMGKENGGTVLRINGKRQLPLWVYGNTMEEYPDDSRFLETMDKVRDVGVRVVMWVNSADNLEHNRYVNEKMFSRYPDCYVVLRMNVESPGREGEYSVNNNGKNGLTNSYASTYWREDMERRFTRYFSWLKEQSYADRIIGFQPMHVFSGEWFFMTLDATEESGLVDDYSEPARQEFIRWLRGKYRTDAALRKAWGDPKVTLETVTVPSLDERDAAQDGYFKNPLCERRSIDYSLFYRTFIPKAIGFTTKMFKRLTGNHCLVGVMYGYNLKMNATFPRPAATGCFGLGEVMKLETVDFISCPCNYGDRRMGLSDEPMGTFDAPNLYGKMVIFENDTRTHVVLAPDYQFPDDYCPQAFGTRNRRESIAETRRDTGIQTVTGNGMYWMDLVSRGWWNDPALWDENQNLMRIHAAKYLLGSDLSFHPQVAFLIDEKAMSYITLNPQNAFDTEHGYLWHLLNYQTWELARSGLTYGYYTMQELPLLPESVRMIIMPHSYYYSDKVCMQLERFKKDGRAILFMYAAGYVSDAGNSVEFMEKYTGIRMKRLEKVPARTIITNPLDCFTQGVTTTTIGYEGVLSPGFTVDDETAITLGVYEETRLSSFARKEMGDWHSVYIGSPNVKAELLRRIGMLCGCHCYLDSEQENLRTDDSLFMYHASLKSTGKRLINLQVPCSVWDMADNHLLSKSTNIIQFFCHSAETKMFLALHYPVHFTKPQPDASTFKKHGSSLTGGVGDFVSFSFSGAFLALKLLSGTFCGRLGVEIDGISFPYIECYAEKERNQDYVIAYGMQKKIHTVRLTVLETKSRNSCSYGIKWLGSYTE